jgi:hypothetical protein
VTCLPADCCFSELALNPTKCVSLVQSGHHCLPKMSSNPAQAWCTRYNITCVCDKVCQWLATGQWFSLGTQFPPPIKLTATIYKYCWKCRVSSDPIFLYFQDYAIFSIFWGFEFIWLHIYFSINCSLLWYMSIFLVVLLLSTGSFVWDNTSWIQICLIDYNINKYQFNSQGFWTSPVYCYM